MAPNLKTFVNRFRGSLLASSDKAPEGTLFPKTDPAIDGEECLHDCDSCTIRLPSKFKINEDHELYGFVKGWSTHAIVATGKTDWVRDIADEEGSVMEAIDKGPVQPSNGRLMLSASNIPLPPQDQTNPQKRPTTVLLLPAFNLIDNVTPETVPDLITNYINPSPTNTMPLRTVTPPSSSTHSSSSYSSSPTATPPPPPSSTIPASPAHMQARPCPHNYLILLCSQKTRDARCGQSAPLIKRELERHLRPLGLYRDLTDERPGGVGIYFISHVSGHKYSANMMIYRRAGMPGTVGGAAVDGAGDEQGKGAPVVAEAGEAAQCIWLARVRPEDCENIVRYTLLQGKVVKPERQLRGGFDRGKGLVSW